MEHKFRKYYHGGRNEIFKIGCINDNIYHYDFTSFYPSIMEKNNFPINKMNIIKIEEQNKKTFNKDWFGLVKCRIRHINKNKRPFHAIHDEEKNIIYPYIDNFIKIILTTDEIKYSIDNNLGYEYEFIKVCSSSLNFADSGVRLGASTLVIQKVEITDSIYKDKVGGVTPFSPTVGTGEGYIARDGKVFKALWSRPTEGSGTKWTTIDGAEISFKNGQIWVALMDKEPIFTRPSVDATKSGSK